MTETILQVFEDNSGRLYFCTDLPQALPIEERVSLIKQISKAIKGNTRVCSAIRQLALGAVMCSEDVEAQKRDFRADASRCLNFEKGEKKVF